MDKEYTVEIEGLKITGSAESIHRLASVYGLAACEYSHQVVEEIHDKHRNNLIEELESEQRTLENTERQLIESIHQSDYYKQYSAEASALVDSILEEIEAEERE